MKRVKTFLVWLSALLCLAAMVAWGFGIARIGYYFSTNVGTQPVNIAGGRGGFTATFPRYQTNGSAWVVEWRCTELFDGVRSPNSCVVEVAPPTAYVPAVKGRTVTAPYWLLLAILGAAPAVWLFNRYLKRTAVDNRTDSGDKGEAVVFPIGKGEKLCASFLILSVALFLSVVIVWICALTGWGFYAEGDEIAKRKVEMTGMRGGLNIVVNQAEEWKAIRFAIAQRYLLLPHIPMEDQKLFLAPSHRVPEWAAPTNKAYEIILPYWLLLMFFAIAPALRLWRRHAAQRERILLEELVMAKRAEHPHLDIKAPKSESE